MPFPNVGVTQLKTWAWVNAAVVDVDVDSTVALAVHPARITTDSAPDARHRTASLANLDPRSVVTKGEGTVADCPPACRSVAQPWGAV
jgi:hypothetical protein